jgi:hypothetical protein
MTQRQSGRLEDKGERQEGECFRMSRRGLVEVMLISCRTDHPLAPARISPTFSLAKELTAIFSPSSVTHCDNEAELSVTAKLCGSPETESCSDDASLPNHKEKHFRSPISQVSRIMICGLVLVKAVKEQSS